MIKKQNIVTGLDMGSSKISAVAAEMSKDGGFTILSQVTQNSKGISKGAIANLNDAVSSVSGVLSKLREKISKGPGDIYVNISGQTVRGAKSSGMIPLSLRGREIAKSDMDRCANVAGTTHLPFDREIIHRIVQRYSVDDKPWIKNPLGLYGSRLACEVYVVSADTNQIQNICKCVNNSGYDAKEVIFTGMADGAALLDKDDMSSSVLLIDIGSMLTEVSIFSEGVMADLEIIQIGANEIKNNFKESPQMEEMISMIADKKSLFNPSSIILTGGGAFIDNLVEFMEEKTGSKINVGSAKDIKGDISSVDSVRLTTAIGLAKYACQRRVQKSREAGNIPKRITDTVVDIFNNYF